ncbi:WRKY DNA-binding protein 70, ARABIDOPSIS THALIANA WRKY DNA-BINDING PROTEIN 70 [Hibiscus trionum]|uniref:WRKY DNA-binding protein 70, ARABIDOPSIS THALIANA WRKY DNA-BINDING PROTEIN 70 n=1 Tax=Hibiscus trionum TaxID=183268 RepID=A0A9W7GSH6_HIBTR|nr:WRKY DNA-binding protein 70, ARABIDOPSIS THALIANA WRKY DNA-BINDING PROTEIN 70 [Hibiscus trionum]
MDTNKIIQQLVQGRELTNKLRDAQFHDSGEDLVIRICNTFSNTLSILRNCNGRKSQDSGDSSLKDPRGSYKRRKCVASRTNISSALTDDGYAWRKYGQKQILNANHPRSYYRCTHKTEQGCQATKQVQKIQDDPPKYETIYSGHHTCKNTLNPCHHSTSNHSSLLISFSLEQEGKQNYKPITYNNGSDYLC